MQPKKPVDPEKQAFVSAVKMKLASLRWTQQDLADQAGIGIATVSRMLRLCAYKGATRRLVEITLARAAEQHGPGLADAVLASPEYGSYARTSIQPYLGWFQLYRRNYREARLRSTLIRFDWSSDDKGMVFYEYSDLQGVPKSLLEFSQRGMVFMGPNTALLHLLSHYNGSVRLITLTVLLADIPPFDHNMYGLILSQYVTQAGNYVAASAPVLLQRVRPDQPAMADYIFEIDGSDARYAEIDTTLRTVETQRTRCASLVARGVTDWALSAFDPRPPNRVPAP